MFVYRCVNHVHVRALICQKRAAEALELGGMWALGTEEQQVFSTSEPCLSTPKVEPRRKLKVRILPSPPAQHILLACATRSC